MVVWECETTDGPSLSERLRRFLSSSKRTSNNNHEESKNYKACCPRPGMTRDGCSPYAFFFLTNSAFTLSINSIFAPCLRMMMLCCVTDSELFQAQ